MSEGVGSGNTKLDGTILQDCIKPYRESVLDKHAFGMLRSWEERSEATAYLVAQRARAVEIT
jgi:hypothetical protein